MASSRTRQPARRSLRINEKRVRVPAEGGRPSVQPMDLVQASGRRVYWPAGSHPTIRSLWSARNASMSGRWRCRSSRTGGGVADAFAVDGAIASVGSRLPCAEVRQTDTVVLCLLSFHHRIDGSFPRSVHGGGSGWVRAPSFRESIGRIAI